MSQKYLCSRSFYAYCGINKRTRIVKLKRWALKNYMKAKLKQGFIKYIVMCKKFYLYVLFLKPLTLCVKGYFGVYQKIFLKGAMFKK